MAEYLPLAASAEMLYLDLPFADRVKRITERGLQVEIWDWSTKDITALAGSDYTATPLTFHSLAPGINTYNFTVAPRG